MKRIALILLVALMNGAKSADIVTDEEKTYTYSVAVVEYLPQADYSLSPEERLNANAAEYISRLKGVTTDLDLILFPEATLGGSTTEGTEVPLPFSEIICNSTDTRYKDYLKRFSCAAIEHDTTVVVNLIEKVNCTLNNATGYCPSTGIVYHNSDVAFNESGGVSGRYRKWNLFGEEGKSPPAEVELVTIRTKNNDSFGMFTCFDIMFGEPALNLTRKLGLKNILFPTMWFSELPFLTALQVQQMWAVENDVNLLSAGANEPREGSGGTGIFIGKEGPLDDEMIGGRGGSRVIVRRVPRLDIANNPYKVVTPIEEDTDALAAEMDSFHLLTDSSVYNYSSVVLNTTNATIAEEVCNGDAIRICCQFNIQVTVDASVSSIVGANSYTYHLVAFNGVRSFSGVRDGGIESCGVVACLNGSVSSCGQRFSNYSEVVWPITFDNISVAANFTEDENRIQFPNSLLSSIRPISPQFSTWSKEEVNGGVRRTHVLGKPQNRLLTFGIFGRDFSRDGLVKPGGNDSAKLNINTNWILFISLCAILYNRLM